MSESEVVDGGVGWWGPLAEELTRRSRVRVAKYESLGNDYLIWMSPSLPTPDEIVTLCDRHGGLGADGVLVDRSVDGKFSVGIFNPDASEAEKSGNGLRIFARVLWDAGRVSSDEVQIHTRSGPSLCRRLSGGAEVSVNMGRGVLDRGPDLLSVDIDGQWIDVLSINFGNPHAVVFVNQLDESTTRRIGPLLERHRLFPERTNVQFVRVQSRQTLQIQIWERGAGFTLASGSSACAAACAARSRSLVDNVLRVEMPGGDLQVEYCPDDTWMQTGPVRRVYCALLNIG